VLSTRRVTRSATLAAAVALFAVGLVSAALLQERAGAATVVGDCTPASSWPVARGDLASQAIQLVNAHRTARGLPPLTVSARLTAAAEWKARHMANYGYLAHHDPAPPVARSAAERLAACGYGAGSGENLAAGYRSAQAVVTAWLNSPGHRANIENPSFVAIGSGAAAGGAGVYWAHDFGTAGDSAPPPGTTAPPPGTSTAPPPPRRTSAAPALVMQGLRLAPRRPRANGRLAGTVAVLRHGRRVTTGRVVCHARVGSKAFDVVVHRFRRGKATCVWRVPRRMHGKLIQAAITVHFRGAQARAPFRARVR
jgi:uncharacterized protein YkwD